MFANYHHLEDPWQVAGKTDFELHPKDLAEKYRADVAEVMALRKQMHVEELAFDGSNIHWLETYKTSIIDAHGNVLGTDGFAGDITERKKVETDLRIAATAFEAQDNLLIICLVNPCRLIVLRR